MLRLPINDAEPGMILALPLVHPLRGKMLLSEGYQLDAALIRKLKELDIHDLWIDYPGTEQIRQYVSPGILNQQSQLVGLVADLFDHVHKEAHADMEFAQYRKALQGLIENLVIEPVAASYIVELGGHGDSDLRHSSEVCFLSVLLGLKLQGYLIQQRKRLRPRDAGDVISLGLGAMLHDIGMTAMDPEVRLRYEQTRDENDPLWQQHVVLGHKMMSGAIPSSAAGVVLHHHQHFDGSGFPTTRGLGGRPCGLSAEDIHVFARIVCVANHFDRLRYLPGGKQQPRVRVLKTMLSEQFSSKYDPVILAVLPQVVPAYAPGTMVRLNNGDRAIVQHWHADAPCQPTVQVMIAPDAHFAKVHHQPAIYDLRTRNDLMIAEQDGIDVSLDNFSLVLPRPQQQKSVA